MLRIMLYLFSRFLIPGLTVMPGVQFPDSLSKEEENELFIKAGQGDEAAREKLILHNLRLVSHIVRKYYPSAPNAEDLNSIGIIGLVKAIDSFKPEKGARFATYGAKCIQNEILMHFRHTKKDSLIVSINETIDTDKDGNPLTYSDILGTDEKLDEDVDREIMCEKLREAIEYSLTERERIVIIKRYGLSDSRPRSQKEVAEALGISRSYISRIEKTAIEKLRSVLCAKPDGGQY
jgi:RNA polymerase sporulation-specific sigma factor